MTTYPHTNPCCQGGPWCECEPPDPDPILEGRVEPDPEDDDPRGWPHRCEALMPPHRVVTIYNAVSIPRRLQCPRSAEPGSKFCNTHGPTAGPTEGADPCQSTST